MFRRDWISFGSERLSPDAESPHTRVAELAKAPKVLWAFSTMCVIIQEIKKHVSVSLSSEDASHSSACLENILHPQKVARLLKVRCCCKSNMQYRGMTAHRLSFADNSNISEYLAQLLRIWSM